MSATAIYETPAATAFTLGQVLARAYEAVHEHGKADCPVCGGTLLSHGVDAECADCSSRLG